MLLYMYSLMAVYQPYVKVSFTLTCGTATLLVAGNAAGSLAVFEVDGAGKVHHRDQGLGRGVNFKEIFVHMNAVIFAATRG